MKRIPPLTTEQINAMTDREFKTYEDRLRREAQRRGWKIFKSKVRDPRATTYGKYCLANENNVLELEWASIDTVDAVLYQP